MSQGIRMEPFRTAAGCVIRLTVLMLMFRLVPGAAAEEVVDIGSRLELFVDDEIVLERDSGISRCVVQPEPREVVFTMDRPWEGNTSGCFAVFQSGSVYRMIYRGWQHDEKKKPVRPEVTCLAESTDGIHWQRPSLGLFEFNGSTQNNIVWQGPESHNFTFFVDTCPRTPPDMRYRALGGVWTGLTALVSPDAVHWRRLQAEPVITNGTFDSQNLAFWDSHRQEYRAYWRYFDENEIRSIRTAVSRDFIHWSQEADLRYPPGTPAEHLYTNAIQPYMRAPHLLIGFPARYDPETSQVEPVLMTSRDGVLFQRSAEAVIPPTAPEDRSHNRSNYMAWGMLQLPDRPHEISVYATENYYERTPGRLRRFVYRVDGFAALRCGADSGSVRTKWLKHTGHELLLNYVVRAGGSLQVEILDSQDRVIGRSRPLTGSAVDRPVSWDIDPHLRPGTVSLKFTLKNADLYSLRFQ